MHFCWVTLQRTASLKPQLDNAKARRLTWSREIVTLQCFTGIILFVLHLSMKVLIGIKQKVTWLFRYWTNLNFVLMVHISIHHHLPLWSLLLFLRFLPLAVDKEVFYKRHSSNEIPLKTKHLCNISIIITTLLLFKTGLLTSWADYFTGVETTKAKLLQYRELAKGLHWPTLSMQKAASFFQDDVKPDDFGDHRNFMRPGPVCPFHYLSFIFLCSMSDSVVTVNLS